MVTIELKKPKHLSKYDYDQLAETQLYAFKNEGSNVCMLGDDFKFPEYQFIRQTIIDPRERLDELIRRTKNQKRYLDDLHRNIKRKVLQQNTALWVMYDDQRIAGYALWDLPQCVSKDVELEKTGWLHALKIKWHKFICTIADFWNNLSSDWRKMEQRMAEYSAMHTDKFDPPLEYLNHTTEELTNEQTVLSRPYKRQDNVYLFLFIIDPMYQKQRLGEKLLIYTMNQIPVKEQDLHSTDGQTVVYGPQKLMLTATKEAMRLYQKVGFGVVTQATGELEGFTLTKTKMNMVRSKK